MDTLAIYRNSPTMSLRQIASRPALFEAWRKVRANRGSAGLDAMTLRQFERDLEPNLAELGRNLLNKTYEPIPSRHVNVLKPNGKLRELAIPAVRDRVAQRAVLDLIDPLFEPQFLDCSFAFRRGRSVEMAVQQIVVARAQGFRWTVDADIDDFFPSIDNRLLLQDVERTINDADILHLIEQWLDAGVLDGKRENEKRPARWRSSFASVQLAARDAVDSLANEFLSQRLDVPKSGIPFGSDRDDIQNGSHDAAASPKSQIGRAVLGRVLEDGLLLVLANRLLLRKALTPKILGLGGAALALTAAAPPAIRRLRELIVHPTGALQGSPISPLLSNVCLHPFDVALVAQGYRLLRYCDDFVILCRTESEAREAMRSAEATLKERRLRLSPEKTRVIPPAEAFDYLGYHFIPDGRVIAPPGIPEVMASRIAEFAGRAARASTGAAAKGRAALSRWPALGIRANR